jgi:hypothetical protein
MGAFAKPKVLIDLAQYQILIEDYNKEDKCEVETAEVRGYYASFIKNFIGLAGSEVISKYNADALGLFYVVRLPDGTVEVKDKH